MNTAANNTEGRESWRRLAKSVAERFFEFWGKMGQLRRSSFRSVSDWMVQLQRSFWGSVKLLFSRKPLIVMSDSVASDRKF